MWAIAQEGCRSSPRGPLSIAERIFLFHNPRGDGEGERDGERDVQRMPRQFPCVTPLYRRTNLIHIVIFWRWRGVGGEVRALKIVVEVELVGVWPERHGVDFLFALVGDIGLNQIAREDAALGEEVVIVFERRQHFAE